MNGILSTLLLLVISTSLHTTLAYRIKGSVDEHKPFVPYEKGFTQNTHEPASTENRTRVNHGYTSSMLLGEQVGSNRLFSCPQMVGPIDEEYFCSSPDHGYCDRRSGTCFCNEGYAGEACQDCAPTHVEVGSLCYPKRLCPNNCSYAGECNYLTGVCECSDHRMGDDCSLSKCSRFHEFCTTCTDEVCLQCSDGWSVHANAEDGAQCEPCWRFDPRCRNCNVNECTSCVDLLLLSIHRSGRRPQDPPLPIDERNRELSVTVPFGSQQADAFCDAEYYELVDPSLVPLNEIAMECHQGLNFDDSITCVPYNVTSHIMCGNHGTITFDSPEYAIREDEQHIRLTLRRSGGGVGEVSVSYSIYPITAGYEDVTSTAFYTGNETVVFRHGQIRASFLVTINDDRIKELDETFSVHLSNPTGGARLGTQSRTIVTIIDDDEDRTCSDKTMILGQNSNKELGTVEAGSHLQFSVSAKTCGGNDQTIGGDTFRLEAHHIGANNVPSGFDTPVTMGSCDDSTNGTYDCQVNATISGNYELDVYQLIPGGLKGYYYTDNYLSDERLDIVRIDSVVNHTWGMGAVTTFGRDFVSVRWEGYVMPSFSETYTFWLDVDDHVRLWIDGILLIDSWSFSSASSDSNLLHAEHDLTTMHAHKVIMEYREISGNATARLLWSSASTPLTAIPSSSLYYKEPIMNSPFSFQVKPSHPSAKETKAFGRGLYEGTAGQEHSFTIDPKDQFTNRADIAGHINDFQATAQLINNEEGSGYGNSFIPVLISYNDHNTLDAVYTPTRSGVYQLNVTLNGLHIYGSPFSVDTSPAATFASESVATGSGLYNGMAGESSSFNIEAFDAYRNRRDSGGDDWSLVVKSSSSHSATDYNLGKVNVNHGNGTYTASVTPLVSGINDLHISLNKSPLKGSPFQMNVVHSQAVGSSSFIVNEEDDMKMIAMTDNTILIQAADEWGNKAIYSNAEPYETSISIASDDIDTDKTTTTYIGGGQNLVTLFPTRTGQISLSIKLNDLHIHHSPFNVTVLPGMFSSTVSSASGVGLSQATAGEEAQFIIQSKDDGGNNKVNDDAHFDVSLNLIGSDDEVEVICTTSFIGNGQYLVSYTAFVSGQYTLVISDETGENMHGSPFSVVVSPNVMSGPRSSVEGQGLLSGIVGETNQVRVQGRDQYNNLVHYATETIEMSMSLTSRHQSDWEVDKYGDLVGSYKLSQIARESGDGLFVLDYTPTISGEYEMSLSTYSPGGLEASYYSTPDLLPDYLVKTELTSTIDKFWEDDDSIDTRTHFGAVYEGKISADHNEEYEIIVECNDGGYASVDIDDQHASWQSCYPKMSMSITMKSTKAAPFTLQYKSLEDDQENALTILKWSGPTISEEIIPPNNLWYFTTVGNPSVYHPVVSPGTLDATQSTSFGFEETVISGAEYEFLVETRDGHGNLLLNGGSNVEVLVSSYQSEGRGITTSITENNNGTYSVIYTPQVTGAYYLDVTIDGSSIRGSPLVLTVIESDETE